MKTMKLSSKLVLNKETIAALGAEDLGKARGGAPATVHRCNSYDCTVPRGCFTWLGIYCDL